MRKRQSGVRTVLLLSMVLHLAVFLNVRGFIIHTRIYKTSDSVPVRMTNIPSSPPESQPIKPPTIKQMPRPSKRIFRPKQKVQRTSAEVSRKRPAFSRLPQREVITRIPGMELPESKIPMVSTQVTSRQSLPSLLSSTDSTSAMGASSQGKGTDEAPGSGRSGGGMGGLVSVAGRVIPRKDDVSIGEKFKVYDEADLPFIKALQDIAQHVVNINKSRKVDIVFIVDTSESMQDDIDAIRRHLNQMIDRFQIAGLDFTLGVVRFHHSMVYEWLGIDIIVSKQTSDVEDIKEILKSIRVSGGERQLDALMRAISEVKFRPGVDRHFILLTDEYVHGTYPVPEVLKAAKRAKITIDVLGMDEPFQRTIAEQTGGIWTSIEKIKEE